MKGLNIFEKILLFFKDLSQFFCPHKQIDLSTPSSELVKGYCDYHGMCRECGKNFRIIIDGKQP